VKKILVVDDEAIYALMLRRALAEDGFDVKSCGLGAEAVALGKTFHPDLLLCDLHLPEDVNGMDVVNALRADLPALRVVLMSGLVDASVKQKAREANIFRVLEKPATLDEISGVVKAALV